LNELLDVDFIIIENKIVYGESHGKYFEALHTSIQPPTLLRWRYRRPSKYGKNKQK